MRCGGVTKVFLKPSICWEHLNFGDQFCWLNLLLFEDTNEILQWKKSRFLYWSYWYPLTQWPGEDQKTHWVGFADLTEYRVRYKSHRVSRKVIKYSYILTEYLTESFRRVHWVRSRFSFSHWVFGRKLTEFTESTRSRDFSPSSRPSEFSRVTVPGGFSPSYHIY